MQAFPRKTHVNHRVLIKKNAREMLFYPLLAIQ